MAHNPYYPDDEDFDPPSLTLLHGPDAGEVIDSDSVTFRWKGNQPEMLFQYQLNDRPIQSLDTVTTVTFSSLADQAYTLRLYAKYPTGISMDRPFKATFQVDAIKEPAFLLSPYKIETTSPGGFYLDCLVDDMTDFGGIDAKIKFDPSYLHAALVQRKIGPGSFIGSSGGTIIDSTAILNGDGTIALRMRIQEGSAHSVHGGGVLARILFKTSAAGSTAINIDPESRIFNLQNETQPAELVGPVPVNIR